MTPAMSSNVRIFVELTTSVLFLRQFCGVVLQAGMGSDPLAKVNCHSPIWMKQSLTMAEKAIGYMLPQLFQALDAESWMSQGNFGQVASQRFVSGVVAFKQEERQKKLEEQEEHKDEERKKKDTMSKILLHNKKQEKQKYLGINDY